MDDTNNNPTIDPVSDTLQTGIVQTGGVLIDFIDETQEEFDLRMIEVKKKWDELDKQLPREERFRRMTIYKEADQVLKEIPKLIDYCDKVWSVTKLEIDALWERVRKFHALDQI